MIQFKRVKNNDSILALYYIDDNNTYRYIIDTDIYNKLPKIKWATRNNTFVTVSGNKSLAIYIATGGKLLGRDKFLNFKDNNIFNLCKDNLEIINRNTYITNGDTTSLYIRSSLDVDTKHHVIFDTKFLSHINQYLWYISSDGYVLTVMSPSKEKKILHRLIISLTEGVNNNLVVDHIDRNRLNNLYTNLRQVTIRQNSQNCNYSKRKRLPDSILGVKKYGDSWVAYSAVPDIPNKTRQYAFSIEKYGNEVAKQYAINLRKKWELELGITSIYV